MVTAEILEPGKTGRLILQPNSSLSWRGNLLVIFSLILISLMICIGFAMMGAWVIFPFAGLELSILALAFRYVHQHLQQRVVISIDQREILVSKGNVHSGHSWVFQRLKTVVIVGRYEENPAARRISLAGDQGLVEVGQFLTQDDQRLLVQGLVNCGLSAHREKNWSKIVI